MSSTDNHTKTGGEQIEFKNKVDNTCDASEECSQLFEELKIKRKHRFIIYKIGESQIEVESVGERSATLQDFGKALPYTDSRYAIFDYEYTTVDGRQASKLYFVR